jgi:hypothetical protein
MGVACFAEIDHDTSFKFNMRNEFKNGWRLTVLTFWSKGAMKLGDAIGRLGSCR